MKKHNNDTEKHCKAIERCNKFIKELKTGKTYQEVGKENGVTRQQICNTIRRYGYSRIDFQEKRKHVYIICTCNFCRKSFVSFNKGKLFCKKECRRLAFASVFNNTSKYKMSGKDGRVVLVHRKVYEKVIGRKLGRWECVHHIDGNKSNNDRNNLALMDLSDHSRMEALRTWNTFKKIFNPVPMYKKHLLTKEELTNILK